MAHHTFICYAHQDTRFALQLAEHLREAGIWVWIDQRHVIDSTTWDKTTNRALLDCARFVLILSPAAANSLTVREQTLLALKHGKPVVPVLYRTCPLPELLQHIEPVDFLQRRRFGPALAQLVARLTGQPPARSGRTLPAPLFWRLNRYGWLFLVGLFILLGVMGYWLWFDGNSPEAVLVPENIKPVLASEPVYVPTTELLPVLNSEPTPVETKIRAADGQEMVFVPAGDFLLGSRTDEREADEDERPQRVIYLDAFWIDKTEISNARYNQCVAVGACTGSGELSSRYRAPVLPVVSVSWEQAMTYCRWVGGRLPTEAEWEKAARGSDGRVFPWGSFFDGTRLNFCDINCVADWRDQTVDDGYEYTAPVGHYPEGASPYGALDMSGNVWEWTADWYAPDAYAIAPYRNPTGPDQGRQRVIRGGSWLYKGRNLRTAERHKEAPTYRYENIGFRCAASK